MRLGGKKSLGTCAATDGCTKAVGDPGGHFKAELWPIATCPVDSLVQEGLRKRQPCRLINPGSCPCLHVFGWAVFVLRQHKGKVGRSEQGRAAAAAKPKHDVRFRQFSRGRIGDARALSKQDERRVLVRDVHDLLDGLTRLGQIHQSSILLKHANMLKIEHVGALRHHDGLGPPLFSHQNTGMATT